MKSQLLQLYTILLLYSTIAQAQTSWTGEQNSNWNVSGNWSHGVPTAIDDVVVGDAHFTGTNHPIIRQTTSMKSLTIGDGATAIELTVTRNISIHGNLIIASNGALTQSDGTQIVMAGNWQNDGIYQGQGTSSQIIFSGGQQTLSGNTSFRSMTINIGSAVLLQNNITVNHELQVNGTLNPGEQNIVSCSGALIVNPGGVLKVMAATLNNNYMLSGAIKLDGRSIVDYASPTLNQTIANALTYGHLRISGGTIKTLQGNLPPLQSNDNGSGRIMIEAGTLDLQTFTANRSNTIPGGAFILTNNGTLKIGGTNAFPANYQEINLASESMVIYNGGQQTVSGLSYGNLTLSSNAGSVEKTMHNTPLSVAGNMRITKGEGLSVAFFAGNNITVNRNFLLEEACSFNAGAFTHTFGGNWSNAGNFAGGTSTSIFSGTSAEINGIGTHHFHNLYFSAQGIKASANSLLEVFGHIQTQLQGTFLHEQGGNMMLRGNGKNLNGDGFQLYNLIINESTMSAANLILAGNLSANASFEHYGGSITFTGNGKIIDGTGPITFHAININGNLQCHTGFSILSNLSIASNAAFSATTGTVDFIGQSFLSGIAWLYNVSIALEKKLTLGAESMLGIGNTFSVNGLLDVNTTTPNTVNYYSVAVAQNITSATYHNLVLSNGPEKTATGNILIDRDFTILEGVSFYAGGFHHTLNRHLNNYGSFIAQTSAVFIKGLANTNILGETNFNELTLDKSDNTARLLLLSDISAVNLHMISGSMYTEDHSVTLTQSRTGNGIIMGTIIRNHPFSHGIDYAFESPQNFIRFTSPDAALNSVTVKVTQGDILDFIPGMEAVTREYEISIPNGTYADASLRLHYENNELNAFMEQHLTLYRHSIQNQWDSIGVSMRNSELNFVEKENLDTSIEGRWAMSGIRNIVLWNGLISNAWENPVNWTTLSGEDMSNRIPGATDAVHLGHESFTYHPLISSSPVVNAIQFGSAQSCTLAIQPGNTLQVLGSVSGFYPQAQIHYLQLNEGALEVGTNLILSDGNADNGIKLSLSTGQVFINDNILQDGQGSITYTDAGSITLHGDYHYFSGEFAAHDGSFIYAGSARQQVAAVPYHHLIFDKTGGQASTEKSVLVSGSLSLINAGSFQIIDTLITMGSIYIGTNAALQQNTTHPLFIHGNWNNAGHFETAGGSVIFCGIADQSVSESRFNTLTIRKSLGTVNLTGDIILNSDLLIEEGILDLTQFSAHRANPGGTLSLAPQTKLKISGTSNFPGNFNTKLIDASSTIEYYGSMAQTIKGMEYGHLVLQNGAENMKVAQSDISIKGDLTINEGATLCPDSFSINIFGNLINQGMIHPLGGTFILRGENKELRGSMKLQNLTVLGGYKTTGELIEVEGNLLISETGDFNLQSTAITLSGNLTNRGILMSNGTATFNGNRQQIIQLDNAVSSSSTGQIIFNGNVAPILNSTSNPQFATVHINNTAGIKASVPWTVAIAMVIHTGASFDGGALTHTFNGHFYNYGAVYSSGNMVFAPIYFPSNVMLDAATLFKSTGIVTLGGNQALTLSGNTDTLLNVFITNTHIGGISPHKGLTVTENLFIASGALLNGGEGYTHTLKKSFTNNGTYNGQMATMIFSGDSTSIDGAGSTYFYNLTFDTETAFYLRKPIHIEKNLILNTTDFYTQGHSIVFSGSSASLIHSGVGPITLDYLEINKTQHSSTELMVPVIIRDDLVLNKGILKSSDANLITLMEDAWSSPGNTNSYVDGPMSKKGNDAFIFPLGNDGFWARIGISAPLSENAEFMAQYIAEQHPDFFNIEEPLKIVSQVEHWKLDRIHGTDEVKVTLFWENHNRSGIVDLDNLVVARHDGSKWVNHSKAGGISQILSQGFVTSEIISDFSPFTFGSLSESNPLPVEFLNIYAIYNAPHASITWSTASEINSAYFQVERSYNAIEFNIIEIVKGAGTSSEPNHYSIIDFFPLPLVSYYRIKQIDFDGTFKYSEVVALNREKEDNEAWINVFPNPACAGNLAIELQNMQDESILVSIFNLQGLLIHTQLFQITPGALIYLKPQILPWPKPGHYIVNIKTNSRLANKPIIIY